MAEYSITELQGQDYQVIRDESSTVVTVYNGGKHLRSNDEPTTLRIGWAPDPTNEHHEWPPIKDQDSLLQAIGAYAAFVAGRQGDQR